MEMMFQSERAAKPAVSIVLLDWSCRESFHLFDYLSGQRLDRDQFEVLWIEYYDRRSEAIKTAISRSRDAGSPPPVDKWIVLDMPSHLYYHKHLMYNVGILASAGEIVTFCDSDGVVSENFVKAILQSFAEDSNIVLHLDQVRNGERKYYPFNYPSLEEITTTGKNNVVDGKPAGLRDVADPIHTRNYGACMSARREDLIAIGGADEHVDYLGYVCGPYDMTWRLVNAGKKELWHQTEWTYHVWHPGQLGDRNYFGPHDGLHISSTALAARRSGRVLPLTENPAMTELRLATNPQALDERPWEQAVSARDFSRWKVSQTRLEAIKLGKIALRKYLPRSVKTYVRSRFRELRKSRSER
ncbi:MAG: hypothetical protein WCH75_31105 [Candidatus Binatia bacterium]